MFGMFGAIEEAALTNRPPKMSQFFWFFFPMLFVLLAVTFGWQWSVGAGLRDKLPRGMRMNFKLYRAFTIIPIVYFICHISFILLMFSTMETLPHASNPSAVLETILGMFLGMIILLPIGLFAMFCMLYNFYFCAKTLKSIELGREAELGDYIGYFFLFWFNFVGLWIIQPSINQITSEGWTPPPPPPGYEPLIDTDSTFDPIPIKEDIPRGELLKTKDNKAFEHDDDFDGLF